MSNRRGGATPKFVTLESALALARMYRADPGCSNNLTARRLVTLLKEIERLRSEVERLEADLTAYPNEEI